MVHYCANKEVLVHKMKIKKENGSIMYLYDFRSLCFYCTEPSKNVTFFNITFKRHIDKEFQAVPLGCNFSCIKAEPWFHQEIF